MRAPPRRTSRTSITRTTGIIPRRTTQRTTTHHRHQNINDVYVCSCWRILRVILLILISVSVFLQFLFTNSLDVTFQNRNNNKWGLHRQQQQQPVMMYATKNFSCGDLFGMDQLSFVTTHHQHENNNNNNHTTTTSTRNCLEHATLEWISCQIGPVVINTSKIWGARGGDDIRSVKDQPEALELLDFENGALTVTQPLPQRLVNTVAPKLKAFLQTAVVVDASASSPIGLQEVALIDTTTTTTNDTTYLLVKRGSYANPCMALSSMYNVFVIVQEWKLLPKQLQIIWLDGHARGNMDAVWGILFDHDPIYIRQLSSLQLNSVIVVNTISAMGDEGLHRYEWNKTNCNPQMSGLVQFRDFVLRKYQRTRSTSPTHILTFLVRKDYMAHPRSNGRTDRTIANLEDDTAYLQSQYPQYTIQVVSFEELPFVQQLSFIVQTDILVSVHGAGNIHAMFLPDHAVFIEYVPKLFEPRQRFRFLSECLNITYQTKPAMRVDKFSDGKITVRLRPDETAVSVADTHR
jgi:hypothetical protein